MIAEAMGGRAGCRAAGGFLYLLFMPKFDLAKTDQVVRLLATPREQRDDGWQKAFLEGIVDASMATTPQQVMSGPDGFAYFVLTRPPVAQAFTPFCVSHVLETCTERGLGIVIEPSGRAAEWVFTYGDLFSLRAYGTFLGDPADRGEAGAPSPGVLGKDTQVMVGAPSDGLLPSWARRVLASFLKQVAHVSEPGALVLVEPSRSPGRNLVFNVFPEDFPSPEEYQKVLNALGWFLPPRRSVLGMSRTAGLERSFVPLDAT
jgi:hypothetical protein